VRRPHADRVATDPSRPRSTSRCSSRGRLGAIVAIVDRAIVKVHIERNKERWKRSGASGRKRAPLDGWKLSEKANWHRRSRERARARAPAALARRIALAAGAAAAPFARSYASVGRAHTEKIGALAAPHSPVTLRNSTAPRSSFRARSSTRVESIAS